MNDTDPDVGDVLTVLEFSVDGISYAAGETASFGQGSITIIADGSFTFIPTPNYIGDVPLITYAITDDFTVGYGTHDIDFGDQALDQESTGFSASYTMGGMSISGHMNETDNVGGSSAVADDKKAYELELSFAF